MSRRKVWEDTIVIALRDLQWRQALAAKEAQIELWERADVVSRMNSTAYPWGAEALAPKEDDVKRAREKIALIKAVDSHLSTVFPPGFLKSDGAAESYLGDVQLEAGERFFLIEVKAAEENIRSEWIKGGKFKAKKLYSRLRDVIRRHQTKSREKGNPTEERDLLHLSLRGHYISWWDGVDAYKSEVGSIVTMPYIEAVIFARKTKDHGRRNRINGCTVRVDGGWPVSIQDVLRNGKNMRLIEGRKSQTHETGLSPAEMQRYVDFLCAGEDGEGRAIHAVIMSSAGTYFRAVTTTKHLVELLRGVLYDVYLDEGMRNRNPGLR